MPAQIRLIALPESQTTEVGFRVAWAAPAERADVSCAPALLDTGDGHAIDLGLLCAPTAVTWCAQRQVDLADHGYDSAGPFTAQLRWGDRVAETVVTPGKPDMPARKALRPANALPTVTLLAISPVTEQPMQRLIKLRVEGLRSGQILRLDGGAGQVHWFSDVGSDDEGIAAGAELGMEYAKPGPYVIMLDLLDADGFWIATLAQIPLDVAYPAETLATVPPATPSAKPPAEMPGTAPTEAFAEPQPWLPYRNIKPRYSVNTYASPGGGTVRRVVSPGIYLSVRAETTIGGQTWYKTAQGDWIAASAVTFFRPSELCGIELGGTMPPPPSPPPPPPPPTDMRRGIVTATALNVRAQPGVAANNPPIGTLRSGAAVTIYEEQRVAGEPWYRIGEGRWVYGSYVRIVGTTTPSPAPATRRGIVTATALNVRARPGVAAGNPPVAVLRAGAEVTVYETRSIGAETWYRLGENRWVLGQWVRLAETTRSTAADPATALPAQLPLGWVVADSLPVRGRPGVAADNPPVGQLVHNQAVPILEQRSVAGVRWFRIGEGQWVEGRNIGVARAKARPASIGTAEHWVGVCLAEQTAIAYEGDRPVFAALIASGLPGTPTVQGIFRTWLRLETGKMSGPGYYIEDVTWTCYFYSGYSLHTAYWHDAFGRPRSHGCVNMSPHDAWWVYRWSAVGGKNSPTVYVYWA